MDKIILQNLVTKWQDSLRFLKGHQADLSPEEWSAIEVLQDLWRNMSFGPDMTREANEMIDVLIGCDKFHSNNRDIITHSKNFRAVAKKFYTENSATFDEVRAAITPQRRQPAEQPVRKPVSAPSPEEQALESGVINMYVKDWHRGMAYLIEHEGELDDSEVEAIRLMRDYWATSASPTAMSQIKKAADALRDATKLHNSNRDIITNSKYVTAAARKYNASKKLHEGFARALADYLRRNPLPTAAPVSGPPIRITDVKIGEHDSSGNWVPAGFYTDLTYLYVRVYYERVNSRTTSVDLAMKFLRPDGTLDPNSSTPGFTLRDQNMSISSSGYLEISGWGNKNGFGFRAGTWKVEIYVDGTLMSTKPFTMRERGGSTPTTPSSYSPALRVTGLTFTDARENKTAFPTSDSFYTGVKYITPVVSYTTLKPNVNLTLYYKMYRPDGTQFDPTETSMGYTWKGSLTTQPSGGRAYLGGFGSDNGGSFSTPGRYKVEIYLDDRLVYTSYFTVSHRPSTVTPPPQPITSGGRHGGGGGKSKAWLWIIGIIVVVGAYFGIQTFLESRADDAAAVMHAISNVDFFKKPGGELWTGSHGISEGDRLLVYETDESGWAHVKAPNGKKGYVLATGIITPEDNDLLTQVTGENGNSSLDAPHKRAALLSLLCSGKLGYDHLTSWRLDNSGKGVVPNTVRYVRLNDGTDPDMKTLFLKLRNQETGENKIAIFAFPTDSACRPVMRYLADAPAGKEISLVNYTPRNGYYGVNYASGDKRVSEYSTPDSDNPVTITGLQFVNINGSRHLIGNTVTRNAQYAAPKITYQNTSGYNGRSIRLDIKVFDNHTGDMLHSSNSPESEYTYSSSFTAGYKGRGTETLDGWGSSNKTWWSGGRDCTYEIYHNGRLLATGRVAP